MRWGLPVCTALSGLGLSAYRAYAHSFAPMRELSLVEDTGLLAGLLLGVALLCSPLDRLGLITRARALELRRGFGVSAALVASLHALAVWATPLCAHLSLLWYEPQLRAGAMALLVLLALALTSFPERWAVKGWRLLHRLLYGAVLLLLLHIASSPHLSARVATVALVLVAAAIALRLAALSRRSLASSPPPSPR